MVSRQMVHCRLSLARTSSLCNVAVPSTTFVGFKLGLLIMTVRSTNPGRNVELLESTTALSVETTGLSTSLVRSTFATTHLVHLVDFAGEVRSKGVSADVGLLNCASAKNTSLVARTLEATLAICANLFAKDVVLAGWSNNAWRGWVRSTLVSTAPALLAVLVFLWVPGLEKSG